MSTTENMNLTWPVVDYAGQKVADVELPADLFNTEIHEFSVQRAVRVDLANRRLGTAHTLDRAVVHGSNRKPFRQKGTGRARAGTTNSPVWRHGGVVHGPEGQVNWSLKMNKKEHYLAFTSVLTEKVQNNDLIVLTKEAFGSAKTKDFVKALKAINASEDKNLLVLSENDENLVKAASNVPSVVITTADNVSVYDVLNAKKLILVQDVIPTAEDEHEHNHEEAK
jgi:large subunit ribosomal protein L4